MIYNFNKSKFNKNKWLILLNLNGEFSVLKNNKFLIFK